MPNRVAAPIETDIWHAKCKEHYHDRYQGADIECSGQDIVVLREGQSQRSASDSFKSRHERTFDHHAKARRRTRYSVYRVSVTPRPLKGRTLTENETDNQETRVVDAAGRRNVQRTIEQHRRVEQAQGRVRSLASIPPEGDRRDRTRKEGPQRLMILRTRSKESLRTDKTPSEQQAGM